MKGRRFLPFLVPSFSTLFSSAAPNDLTVVYWPIGIPDETEISEVIFSLYQSVSTGSAISTEGQGFLRFSVVQQSTLEQPVFDGGPQRQIIPPLIVLSPNTNPFTMDSASSGVSWGLPMFLRMESFWPGGTTPIWSPVDFLIGTVHFYDG